MKGIIFLTLLFGVIIFLNADENTMTPAITHQTDCYCSTPSTTTVTTPTTAVTMPTTTVTTSTTTMTKQTTAMSTQRTSSTACTCPTASTLTVGIPFPSIYILLPPQTGEIQVTLKLTLTFTATYHTDYSDPNTPRYKDYTTNIFNQMFAAFRRQGLFRLIRILFRSLLPGSVIVDMQLIIAVRPNDAINNVLLQSAVVYAISKAFPDGVNITEIFIGTKEEPIIPPPIIVDLLPIITRIICSFNDQYDRNYINTSSVQYILYTNQIFTKMVMAFQRNGLMRLIKISFNSLLPGSVIANMTLSSVPNYGNVSKSQVMAAMVYIMKDAFNGSASIISISDDMPMLTTTPQNIVPMRWQIFLIVLFSVFILAGIILCLVLIISCVRSRKNKLLKYRDTITGKKELDIA